MVSRLRWSLLAAALFTTGWFTGAVWQPTVIMHADADEAVGSPAPANSSNEDDLAPLDREPSHVNAPIGVIFDRVLDLECHNLTLQDFANLLKAKLRMNVSIDEARIADEGNSLSSRISCDLKATRLQDILEFALAPLQLTALIRGGVLQITTEVRAAELLTVRAYHIGYLYDMMHLSMFDEMIMDTIKSVISPESWDDVGGPGSVRSVEKALLIRQTFRVHRQLEQFFADLESMANQSHPDRMQPQAYSVRTYPVGLHDIEALSRALQETVDPASWQPSSGLGQMRMITWTPNRRDTREHHQQGFLIIRQTNHNHRLIRDLLSHFWQ